MLARDVRRLAMFGFPIFILLYAFLALLKKLVVGQDQDSSIEFPLKTEDPGMPSDVTESTHMEVFSVSTRDKKYFRIDFGRMNGMNPNIIPHPRLEDSWIVVAQEVRGPDDQTAVFNEISCHAAFRDGMLRCVHPPIKLPIAPTMGDKCTGELSYFNLNIGPHDARLFYGPEEPYILYGSNSAFTCFGLWIHDYRELVDDWVEKPGNAEFNTATELQRPNPYSLVEKNWFLFWDTYDQMYVHYDLVPKRVFAKVHSDGSVGEDLAPPTAPSDDRCLRRYMPMQPKELESIHQATNSLKITMCNRKDVHCIANDSNTFIFTIWQHKTYYNFHSVYEPYVMMFRQRAPFLVHAVSKQPIWIHGREVNAKSDTSEMLYITSMNWKKRGKYYHGYLDDELFLGFGIEDASSGGIDVLAGDLLANLGLCLER